MSLAYPRRKSAIFPLVALGELLPPGMCPCRWASCSLFTDIDELAKKRRTFKKLQKFPFAAQLEIAANSGALLGKKHIDFWMYDTFDPVAAIVDVKAL